MKKVKTTDKIIDQSSRIRYATLIFGILILIFLMYVLFFPPPDSAITRAIIRFLLALCAGLFTILLSGRITVHGAIKQFTIKAAGGISIFVLIMFVVNPFPEPKLATEKGLGKLDTIILGNQINNFISGIPLAEYSELKEKYEKLQGQLDKETEKTYEQGVNALKEAKAFLEKRKFLTAISFLKIAAELMKLPEPYLYLGSAYLWLGETSESITEFKRAIELDKDLVKAWTGLGFAYLTQNNYQQASQAFESSIQLDPNDCSARVFFAQIQAIGGQLERAHAQYREAFERDSTCSNALVGLAEVLIRERIATGWVDRESYEKVNKEVIEYLKRAIEIDPQNTAAKELLELRTGVREVSGFPKDPQTVEHLLKGEQFFASGRTVEALKEYKIAERFSPKDPTIQLYIGDACFALGSFKEAIFRYKRVIEFDSTNFRAWRFLGDTYERLGQLSEARDAYQKSIESNPGYLIAKEDLARVLRKIKSQQN